MSKKVLEAFGIILLVVIGVPLVKIAVAFIIAAIVGLTALVVSAPLIIIPLCLVLGGVALIDYVIVKWLIKIFKK